MAAKRPLFTKNFSANLDDIETFLGADEASYFAKFFDRLVDEIVPHACRFPLSGRSFLDRSIHSTEAQRPRRSLNVVCTTAMTFASSLLTTS